MADTEATAPAAAAALPGAPAPKRVAFLLEPSPFTHLSGYTNRFESLVAFLMRAEVDVMAAHAQHLSVADAPVEQAIQRSDAPLPVVPVEGGQRLWFWFGFKPYDAPTWRLHSMLSRRVGAALDTQRPELIHVSTPGFAAFGGVFWAASLDVPLVFSYHTHVLSYIDQYMNFLPVIRHLAYQVGRALIYFTMLAPDLVLCPSPELVEHLTRDVGVSPDKVRVWKKGVDAETFHPRFRDVALRRELLGADGPRPRRHLLLNVCRLAREKNLEELKPWLAALPDCTLAIVGSGPDEGYYRSLFAKEIEAGAVVFVGQRRGDDLSKLFASADVFVMPSRSETLGFVVLEAMTSGVPVVATRSGGIPSIIHHAKDSFLYAEGDVDDAIRLTRCLLEDPELHAQISREARREAESVSWAASHSHVLSVQYPEAIRSHAARRKAAGFPARFARAALAALRRLLLPGPRPKGA
eukprot:TRINITY_DN46382_c0_g1_i1.p1 TRINITY_DN46382_c0_g1~~TRINITY_DN46382_c0_g1_i1.p1  ORF type:complete len:495 (+),score=100.22 TRINITY_DN46382_c0_g1_i1:90-1487(+)